MGFLTRALYFLVRPFAEIVDVSDSPDVREYGFEEVPAARRQELFNAHTRLDAEGFTEVRRGFFVREGAPEIFHVLSHHARVGVTYISWGVSLAFVPHEFGTRVRFHRTLKSADLDLFNPSWGDEGANYLHTETPWIRDMKAMWARAWPRAVEFWDRGSAVEGVLHLAEALSAAPPTESGTTQDSFFITGPKFVRSMALARLGREAEARASLVEWAERWSGADLGSKFSLAGAEIALERVLALPPAG